MAEQMKSSRIDWIGDIPKSWGVEPIKYRVSFYNGDRSENYPSKNEMQSEGIPFINAGHIEGNCLNMNDMDYIAEEKYRVMGGVKLQQGDILYCLRGSVGKNIIVNIDKGTVASSLVAIRSNGILNKYLYYCLNSNVEEVQRCLWDNGTAQPNLSADSLGKFKICIPPDHEQQAIADFLDKECAQIDSIAADLEKQIALLQQYKKSLITETVTKGLDNSTSMKDSGIEGVGKIPSHWTVNRLKYAAVVKTGPFGTQLSASEYSDEGIPVINVKNIGYGTIIEDDLDYVPDEVCQRLAQHQLQLGDIVFGRKGAVDKHAIITESQIGWVQGSDCIRVRIYGDIDSRYLNYLFDTVYFAEYVLLYAVGTTMASINSDILTNSKILVPPITEQRGIADFLDSKCRTLFEIIENKQSQLATLQQHKKSLIYEYVTGKKRVKEVR